MFKDLVIRLADKTLYYNLSDDARGFLVQAIGCVAVVYGDRELEDFYVKTLDEFNRTVQIYLFGKQRGA